uniref:Uncharacterized protein n=1 Tax=Anguilla anguilla TaxID=7936 RepID=A0A0E9SDQ4_ANGAN
MATLVNNLPGLCKYSDKNLWDNVVSEARNNSVNCFGIQMKHKGFDNCL